MNGIKEDGCVDESVEKNILGGKRRMN